MNLSDHYKHLTLTADQQSAIQQIENFLSGDERVFILQGYAGTGKTTLLKGIAEFLHARHNPFLIVAPTGRAAKVIEQRTGFNASTIHRAIYTFDDFVEIKKSDKENDLTYYYKYKINNNLNLHNLVFLSDESSMISDVENEGEFYRFGSGRLLMDLIGFSRVQDISASSKIIFIGDVAQLPPINMNFSPALSAQYLKTTFNIDAASAVLKDVRRQSAESGILSSATRLRMSLTSGFMNSFNVEEDHRDIFKTEYDHFIQDYFAINSSKIAICFSNKTANDLNKSIRLYKYGQEVPIRRSDTVIVANNNYKIGLMNGELAIVDSVDAVPISRTVRFYTTGRVVKEIELVWRYVTLIVPSNENNNVYKGYMLENFLNSGDQLAPEQRIALYIDFLNRNDNLKKGTSEFKETLYNDPYINPILLKYGYVITCHKAQGGEWKNAFVFWDKGVDTDFDFYSGKHDARGKKNADFFRWAYTAITRATRRLYCINPPSFSIFSSMVLVDQEINHALNTISVKDEKVIQVEMCDELFNQFEFFGLNTMPSSFRDHFAQRWYSLNEHDIAITHFSKNVYEVQYQFSKDNKQCAIKYSININDEFNQTYYQIIPSKTFPEAFGKEVVEIIDSAPRVIIRNPDENSEPEDCILWFSDDLIENKPFLHELYRNLKLLLAKDELIQKIDHLDFRERYTIKRSGKSCTVDFIYDKDGIIGNVMPLPGKCNSEDILRRLHKIIDELRNTY